VPLTLWWCASPTPALGNGLNTHLFWPVGWGRSEGLPGLKLAQETPVCSLCFLHVYHYHKKVWRSQKKDQRHAAQPFHPAQPRSSHLANLRSTRKMIILSQWVIEGFVQQQNLSIANCYILLHHCSTNSVLFCSLVVPGIEVSALHLLEKSSTAWTTCPVLLLLVFVCFLFFLIEYHAFT
jgi:hypothetical protein